MRTDMGRNNSNLAIWFLSGAVLGAVVAALITPETGAGARRKLVKEAERGRKSFLESGQELFARGRELFERGREIVDEAAEVLERSRRIAEKRIDDRI
jgi:gas vesicle protein